MKKILFFGAAVMLIPSLVSAASPSIKTMSAFAGGILLFFTFVASIIFVTTVFWILMLIHAASKEIENKALWLIIILFLGFIGAVVYYFAIKRPADKHLDSK